MNRRLVYAACLLVSVCCLTAMLGWPEARADDATAAAPATPQAAESPATPFAVKVAVHNLDKGWLTRLTLSGEFKDAAVLDKSIMIRGHGSTVDANGKVLGRNLTVGLEIAPTVGVTDTSLDHGTQLVRFAEHKDVLLHLEPTDDGGLQAIGAAKSATSVVSFQLPPALVKVASTTQLATFSGSLFAQLAGIGPATCSPTFTEFCDAAITTCSSNGRVCEFSYSCCVSDKSVECKFECQDAAKGK